MIVLLTWTNSRGLEYGKIVQNVFTTAKVSAIAALILAGLFLGRNAEAIHANFTSTFALGAFDPALGVAAGTRIRTHRRDRRGAIRLAVLGRCVA